MIAACHQHQWPSEYGRPAVEVAVFGLDAASARAQERTTWDMTLYSTWCERCGCDHGAPPHWADEALAP